MNDRHTSPADSVTDRELRPWTTGEPDSQFDERTTLVFKTEDEVAADCSVPYAKKTIAEPVRIDAGTA
jgi:hypothetical protein